MNGLRRIFYDVRTGERIVEVGRSAGMRIPTVEQDIATYKVLAARVRNTFAVLELPYDQYAEEFRSTPNYRVNPATKRLEFSTATPAPSPTEPTPPPVYEPPISETVQALADENAGLLLQNAIQDVNIAALQDENAELMMRLAQLTTGGTADV